MTPQEQQINSIVAQLEVWSDAYYTGVQQVDDKTFDALEDKLFQLDPGNPYFNKNREKPFKYGTKVKHTYDFIGSIDKIHAVMESRVLRTEYPFASAKLDGTSLVVYFKDGKVVNAVTRGNGEEGVDVTPHYNAITKKYKIAIPPTFTGAIRGEVVFSNANWQHFKKLHPEAKLARNSGTGLLNQKVVQPEEALLDYVIYDVIATNIPFQPSLEYMWDFLSQFGYKVAPHAILPPDADDNVMDSLYFQWNNIYPCDGLVLRAQPEAIEEGTIYKYTRDQEAYKFKSEMKVCEVEAITWQLGMTGKLTPVLQIDPVEMGGAIVTNITAHNAKRVKEDKLGIGAIITAQRSGDVIPKLETVVTPAKVVDIPTVCPCCGAPLILSKTQIDLYCENPDCKEVKTLKVINYIKCICEGIKGIGDKFLDAFLKELDAYSIQDLLLTAEAKRGNTFITLGNADNEVAKQVLDRLLSPQVNLEKFLRGLGIELLGIEASRKMAGSALIQELFEIIQEADLASDKAKIEIFKEVQRMLPRQEALSNNVVKNAQLLQEVLYILGDKVFAKATKLIKERYYVITGSLSKGRKQIEDEFAANGWIMKDSLNGDTEVLICNDPNSTSSKFVKARHLGKPIVTEEEFRKTYLGA